MNSLSSTYRKFNDREIRIFVLHKYFFISQFTILHIVETVRVWNFNYNFIYVK